MDLVLSNSDGLQKFGIVVIACPNPNCKKVTATVSRHKIAQTESRFWEKGELLQQWRLIPESSAKVLPEYVPLPIVEDYREACMISEKSPKASATLARRCLQGMIRDFFGVSKTRLVDEINAIRDKVDPLTWDAIDAVRSIGNIGAHMERDINLIIDVDEGEAKELIGLIELLIEDWYVAQHSRQARLSSIREMAKLKDEAKQTLRATSARESGTKPDASMDSA